MIPLLLGSLGSRNNYVEIQISLHCNPAKKILNSVTGGSKRQSVTPLRRNRQQTGSIIEAGGNLGDNLRTRWDPHYKLSPCAPLISFVLFKFCRKDSTVPDT